MASIIAAQRKALIQNAPKRADFFSHSGKHQNFIRLILHFRPQKINGRILQNLLLSTIILVGFFRHEYRHFFFRQAFESTRPRCSALQSQFYNIYTLKSIRKTLKHSQNCHRSIPFLTYLSYCPSPLLFFRQSTPHFFSVVRNEKS